MDEKVDAMRGEMRGLHEQLAAVARGLGAPPTTTAAASDDDAAAAPRTPRTSSLKALISPRRGRR